jgi:hypothetical protein
MAAERTENEKFRNLFADNAMGNAITAVNSLQ